MRRSIAFNRCISMIAAFGASLTTGCSRDRGSTTAASSRSPANRWSGHEAVAAYGAQHGKTVYQVTYQPEAVVFDQASTERALQDISANGATYSLDANVPAVQQLKAGSVLFLYGVAIRKVTAVQVQGATVVATTADGDITDLIKDGHIEWKMPIDYGLLGAPAKAARSGGFEDFFVARALAQSKVISTWKMSLGGTDDKFKWELQFDFDPDRFSVYLQGSFSGSEGIMDIHAKGYVQDPTTAGNIDIRDGQIFSFTVDTSGFSGHVDFDWSGQRKSEGVLAAIDRDFKIKPASIDLPFTVEGIPLVIETSMAVIIHPAFTSTNAVTHGEFSLDFNGNTGVITGSSPPQSRGEMHGNATIGHGTDVESLGAMGFTAALELPRFELSAAVFPPGFSKLNTALSDTLKFQKLAAPVLGKTFLNGVVNDVTHDAADVFALPIKPYAFANVVLSTGIFTNGKLTSSLVAQPPCKRAQVVVTANVGVGVKLNFRLADMIFKALQKATAPKLEFSVASPNILHSFKAWRDHIKCPDDD